MLLIKIETDNAAFEDDCGTECAKILKALATKIADHHVFEPLSHSILDSNGNVCGSWRLS